MVVLGNVSSYVSLLSYFLLTWQSFRPSEPRWKAAPNSETAFRPACTQSNLVRNSQQLPSTFADDDTGRHRVAGRHTRHDGTVSDTKIVDSIDLEMVVYN